MLQPIRSHTRQKTVTIHLVARVHDTQALYVTFRQVGVPCLGAEAARKALYTSVANSIAIRTVSTAYTC